MKRATLAAIIATSGLAAQVTFRSAVDSISIDVSVKDRNVPVLGLTDVDFILTDNGVPQPLQSITSGAVPIDITLFLDTSASVAGARERLKSDIGQITALLRPVDRFRLLVFDDQVRNVFGWRSPGTLDVEAAMQPVDVGLISSVYDGVALSMLHKPDPDRRHLIIAMTDEVDAGSITTSAAVREMARRIEGVLHLVQVTPGGHLSPNYAPLIARFATSPDAAGFSNLEEAALLTGGEVHGRTIFGGQVDIVKAFKKVFDDFRQSYILRYNLTGVPREGWHDVKVQVTQPRKLTIRARRGYFR
jgi:VWFA-related protein